ncbi:unknown [Firmicutes bacterium CAG:884]|nr:unknown [Firmicutes bacterium CAG:884]
MQEKRYYIPESRPKMALFRIVSEYLGLIDDSKTVKENGLIY